MSASRECVCGADEPCTTRCEKHDRVLHGYPCSPCQDEWAATHPNTAAAIRGIASGKRASLNLAAARRADEALNAPERTTP